jgi:pimeloyl-ACP methyl ester carboxylesterase
MVGHSLGGLFQRLYDAHYPGEVSGFIFVDSTHPEQMERFPDEVVEFMKSTLPPVLLTKVLSRLGVIRLTDQIKGELLPEQVQAAVRGLGPESVEGLIGEMEALEETLSQAQMTGHLGSRPIVVLSAGDLEPPPGLDVPPEVVQSLESTGPELQEEISALSTNSVQRIIENSGHYIQIEAPDAVITAVADVVKAVREGQPIGVEGSH